MKKFRFIRLKIALFMLAIILSSYTYKIFSDDFELSKNLDIFFSITKELNTYYVDDIDNSKLFKKAIDEMLKYLDPYTTYIPAYLIDDYRLVTTGKYGGIGVGLEKTETGFTITDIYENSPAANSGLLIGDIITHISNIPILKHSMDDLSVLLKGSPGSLVELGIKRMDSNETFNFKIKREIINIESVPVKGIIDEKIAYIKLASFSENSSKEFERTFDLLKKHNPQGLIIDLRDNGGGLLLDAVNIVNFFVKKGERIVETKSKLEQMNKTYIAENHPINTEIPIVVLVNNSSASASEIVSGALQDLDRAIIIGQKTYGKGLVQMTRPLPYNAQLKITISKYYIPSGRCIQRIHYFGDTSNTKKEFYTKAKRIVYEGNGIIPDIEITEKDSLNVLNNLNTSRSIFNFITFYHLKNPKVSYTEFENKKEIFEEFQNFLSKQESYLQTFTYYQSLKKLKEEGQKAHLNESHEKVFQELTKVFQEHILSIIQQKKDYICTMLNEEFARRYLTNQERLENSPKDDIYVKEAIRIILNSQKYNSILYKE